MNDFEIVVIGGGPGGYVAAIESAKLGYKTALIEKEDLGGTCLNRGCISSKSLLKSAELADELFNKAKQKGFLIEKMTVDFNKVIENSKKNVRRLKSGLDILLSKKDITIFDGEAKFVDKDALEIKSQNDKKIIKGKNIIISTGSKPSFPSGLDPNGEIIVDSDFILNSDKLPPTICIVGGGYIGIEFAYLYSSFGVEVSIIEKEETILSSIDSEIVSELKKSYKKRGIKIYESTSIRLKNVSKFFVEVQLSSSESVKESMTKFTKHERIKFDRMLVSTGRIPNTESLNLDSVGITKDNFGFIKVDKNFKTSVDGIYAIGDVIGGLMLAHKASKEGFLLVNNVIAENKDLSHSPLIVPACIYCQPEISYIGITEDMAKIRKIKYDVVKYPFKANGKSLATDDIIGFCKLLVDENKKILGAHIIGKGATEMISEIALIMSNNLTIESITNTIHPHPTLSEVIFESALVLNNNPRNF